MAEPGLRPPLENLLRVLQREVVLEVVHAAARALAQHLAVVLVQLEGVAEVEECLGLAALLDIVPSLLLQSASASGLSERIYEYLVSLIWRYCK